MLDQILWIFSIFALGKSKNGPGSNPCRISRNIPPDLYTLCKCVYILSVQLYIMKLSAWCTLSAFMVIAGIIMRIKYIWNKPRHIQFIIIIKWTFVCCCMMNWMGIYFARCAVERIFAYPSVESGWCEGGIGVRLLHTNITIDFGSSGWNPHESKF